METTFETVRLTVDDGVATVWMNRPDKRNAFNAAERRSEKNSGKAKNGG